MPAPDAICKLVEAFRYNLREYKNIRYNETSIRVEFVNPFWEALGWDVNNRTGYALAYRDVIHEDEVRVGGAAKAPDYAFRVGGRRIFFLETKKPSIDLRNNPEPAFQLRRYAYSAKLPVSMLTDFEELCVYDTRIKPALSDAVHVGRIGYYTFEHYIDKWDELEAAFSKEAVMRGAFDRYVQDNQAKRGAAELDRDFLNSLDEWRIHLAQNIALRNPQLSQRELNYCVQMTLDRLIFLRMAEDRSIESYGSLQALLNGENSYRRLVQLYYSADERYNSGLFHFEGRDGDHPDTLTPALALDDKVLKEIIRNLYYPCPYEFSQMPVEVLGNAYEQFLGKTITLTAGHRAKIEEKPEVRKAGGVYYTPQYIVDYIVEHTVGELLKDKSPTEVSRLRILDPACGSGSFLLGAYEVLLNWHLKVYQAEYERSGKLPSSPENSRRGTTQAIFQGKEGEWFLSTAEKKRILLNNIYGVDIDANAVEVTKLSLLLKVLEDENSETLNRQLGLWRERALPNLADNIKCGNSLIGPDYYQQTALFDEEEMLRVNAFDWRQEFAEVFAQGGFDAVIGNPPYVRQETLGEYKAYFQHHFRVYHGVADLYTYFIEKGLSLLRQQGYFSYIVANKWLRANYGQPLRQWLKTQHLIEVIDFGDLPVFKGATTYPCILVIKKDKAKDSFRTAQVDSLEFSNLTEYLADKCHVVDQASLADSGWSLMDKAQKILLEKIKLNGIPLGKYVQGKIFYGIKTGLNEAFVISSEQRTTLISEDPKSEELIKPFLAGRDVKRYEMPIAEKYLIFTRRGVNIKNYPAIEEHLRKFKELLMPKPKDFKGDWKGRKPGNYEWYEIQDTVDYYKEFEKPKIIIPAIIQSASYAYDVEGNYSNDKTSIIPTDDLYLLGILNSKVADFFIHSIASTKSGGYYEYKPMYVSQIPIRKINSENVRDEHAHNRLVAYIQTILDLHKTLSTAREPRTREQLHRQITTVDAQIDQLVYELYGLSEEEIKIVESA